MFFRKHVQACPEALKEQRFLKLETKDYWIPLAFPREIPAGRITEDSLSDGVSHFASGEFFAELLYQRSFIPTL
jgi:hypothetical protein